MTHKRIIDYIGEIFPILFIVIVTPIILISVVTAKLEKNLVDAQLNNFRIECESMMNNAASFAHSTNFWSHMFQEIFYQSVSPSDFLTKLEKFEAFAGVSFCKLIISEEDILINTLRSDFSNEEWLEFSSIVSAEVIKSIEPVSDEVVSFARKFLGPHITSQTIRRPLNRYRSRIVLADFVGIFPDCWFNANDDYFVLLQLPDRYKSLETGLNYLFERTLALYPEADFGVLKNGKLLRASNDEGMPDEVRKALNSENFSFENIWVSDNYMIRLLQLNSETQMFAYKKIERFAQSVPRTAFLIIFCYFFFLVLFAGFIRTGIRISVGIKTQVVVLLLLANLLPAYILITTLLEHFHQKTALMIRAKHLEQISYLQEIDRKVIFEASRIYEIATKARERLAFSLENSELSAEMVEKFSEEIGVADFHVIASDGVTIGADHGFFSRSGYLPFASTNATSSDRRNSRLIGRIGYLFLAMWNKAVADSSRATEVEIVVEGMFQAQIHEVFQSFVQFNNRLNSYGLGTMNKPVYISTIDAGSDSVADYLVMAFFETRQITHNYLIRHGSNIARNFLGSRIFIGNITSRNVDMSVYGLPEDMLFLLHKAEARLGYDPEIIEVNGEKHIYSGIVCEDLRNIRLAAIHPVANVYRMIWNEFSFYLYIGILSVLLIFGVALLFLYDFIAPVKALQSGATAMKEHKFDHRLSDFGADEFGEIARIFNQNMEDLSELAVAGCMQTQIMPTSPFVSDKISIFGKSVILSGLGGDYFDYFKTSDTSCSLMMGDVAGHGVGASLLMIVAKTTVLMSQSLWTEPQEMISRLHSIILAIKSKKQRKTMTFQFMHVDFAKGRMTYSNAGACSPIFIQADASRHCEEVSLQGAPLGAFKKSKFNQIGQAFNPGDAFVFYTDGIIESINSAGEMLGYDEFKELVVKCRNDDAELFYRNIMEEFNRWLGQTFLSDDLTIMIAVFSDVEKHTLPVESANVIK